MAMKGLLPLLEAQPGYQKLARQLRILRREARGEGTAHGVRLTLLDAAKPFVCAALADSLAYRPAALEDGRRVTASRRPAPLVLVTPQDEAARRLYEQILAYTGAETPVHLFPALDALFYERPSGDSHLSQRRLALLGALLGLVEPPRPDAETVSGISGTPQVDGTKPVQTMSPMIIITSARALMQKILAPADYRRATMTLKVGERLRLNDVITTWVTSGFEPVDVVVEPGSFSRRGGIIDIYPPSSQYPVRIELFDDEIESLRLFDPATQRSVERIQSLTIAPPREVILGSSGSEAGFANLQMIDPETIREIDRDQWARDIERIRQGTSFTGIEFYAPYCCNSSLMEYLPKETLLLLDEPEQIATVVDNLDEQAQGLKAEMVERGELPESFMQPYHPWDELQPALQEFPRLLITYLISDIEIDRHDRIDSENPGSLEAAPPGGRFVFNEPSQLIGNPGRVHKLMHGVEDMPPLPFRPAPTYGGRLREVLDDLGAILKRKQYLVVTTQQGPRLAELLNQRDIIATPAPNLTTTPVPGAISLIQGSLSNGWLLMPPGTPDLDHDDMREPSLNRAQLVVLTDAELWGWVKPRRVIRRRSAGRENFISDLQPGDFVVHIEHGIGKFVGLQRKTVGEIEREYMVLQYAEGDTLFVPTDQVDRINRYIGSGDHEPGLHRLGTGDWHRTKERVRKAAREIARDLLELYAKRELQPGNPYPADTEWQTELEAAFPYIETPDQARAIAEVKDDMVEPKPMDRLLCGDVGYGKTEVALRAAFKAANAGRQVAVLVPTTILAQQHYNTFRERMAPFPVRVEMLSRFRSKKEQEEIIEGLATGQVDICIGTHRLIQKDVVFKNLGLLIIDEEQRFGVQHKERLKQMRQEVDVLTMTATPIPRTLHMALVGLRDISTIDTPPEERLPIRTYVTGYDDMLVREVILRELDRDGQIFFVHNRVQNIYTIANKLAQLVPEASFVVGHGQMDEDDLEKVMVDFSAGKYDVLICSTIIESGLDIPNVNTIIVNNADRFGLAQLYQLRGRVGRGANRAYAYFLYPREKQLTEIAEKRLRTIFEATELGAGFRIAMKDLEMRGAGNLLGAEQSGQIAAVGFDLYTRLLAEEVRRLQAQLAAVKATEQVAEPQPAIEPVEPLPSVTIDLPLTAHLPASYISDPAQRLNIYQRLANATTSETVGQITLEMQDRFGKLPKPALDLIYILQLKVLAARSGIASIGQVDDELVIRLGEGTAARLRSHDLERKLPDLRNMLRIGPSTLRMSMYALGKQWQARLQLLVETIAEQMQMPEIGVYKTSIADMPSKNRGVPAAKTPTPAPKQPRRPQTVFKR